MRLLVVNPNTSASVTERIASAARHAASPGTEIAAVTASWGVPLIVSRADVTLAACAALEAMAANAQDCDAIVLAAFGDPGLDAARELMPMPVAGMAESAMLTACMLARRFSLVSFAPELRDLFQEQVSRLGLAGRLASMRFLAEPFRSLYSLQEEKEAGLLALCRQAVQQDGADLIILAGAPLSGLAARLALCLPVPILDGVSTAVRQAEALSAFSPRGALARRPAGKAVTGVNKALQQLFEVRTT